MTEFGTPDRVADATLWDAVARTLRTEIVPVLPPGSERDAALQLIGLADYARTRPADDAAERTARLADALGDPAEQRLSLLLERAGAVLAEHVFAPQASTVSEVAARVRVVVLDQLRADTDRTAPLLESFAGHPAVDVEPVERVIGADEQAALTGWLRSQWDQPITIVSSSVMSGGHSRRMVRIGVDVAGAVQELVVRVEQGGMFGTDGTTEARAMQELAAAGLPIPTVRSIEPSDQPLGHPFFVMDFAPGRSEATPGSLEAFVHELHRLHCVDPAGLVDSLGPVPTPEHAVESAVDRWTEIYRQSTRARVPLLEEAAAWLRRNLHPTGPTVVVHGDPGPGNYLHVDDRITAITDLEFVHYGDAAEDWTYLATIRARKLRPAEEWYVHIEELTGVGYDPADRRAWEVFNQFKGACANLTALRRFRDTPATAPNLLAIGTAIHLRFLGNAAALIGADLEAAGS